MALAPGTRLGPYEVVAPIGAGGMGEVYKARDTRLDRTVAVKILPDALAADSQFRHRFDREARTISQLDHQHICALYDVGEDRGTAYLVMQYLEGETLANRLTKGALPFDQALQVAIQIAAALATAHKAGIIHRDLKPGNIMLTKSGAKLLDFGLAKTGASALSGTNLSLPTTAQITQLGSILGTLQYMAPEQLEGREADARTDIFAFGAVLYEMVTGKKAFEGTSQATLISSIMSANPPPIATSPLTPAVFDRLVRKCPVKDREDRWQTARDVEHALELVAPDAPESASSADTTSRRLRRWRGAAAVLTLMALGLVVWTLWLRTEPSLHVVTLEATLPENARLGDSADTVDTVSVSPDGRKLVIAGGEKSGVMWIRDLQTLEWKPLPGTEGGANAFWSPDSRFLAFAVGNQIKKVDVSGGPPQTLCTLPSTPAGSGAWNQDGLIVFGSIGIGAGGPLWKISQAGGTATAITTIETSSGELFHSLPSFLPDGKHFLYFRGGPPAVEGVYAGSLDAKPGEQSRERIMAGRFAASYVNGYLVFMRENTLMAQPFNAGRLQLLGEPEPIADPVSATWYSVGLFSISPSGVLAYRAGPRSGRSQLTWLDEEGKILSAFGQPGTDAGIALSPDGTRGVVVDSPRGPGDLWTLDFARGSRTRLTFDGRTQLMYGPAGVWSQDGSRIAFAAGNSLDTLYVKDASGAGEEKELLKEPNRHHVPTSWSRDGRFLLYHTTNTPQTGDDLWVLPLFGDRKPVLLLATAFNEWAARFSPDMRWIAYNSNESGRAEVFVRPFLATGPSGAPSLGEGKWQVSKDGGRFPRWRADGKEILFEDTPLGTGKMAVEVKTRDTAFEFGLPHQLFQGPTGAGWDVSPDGRRFLIVAPPVQSPNAPITVVLNWTAAVKK